MNKVEVMFKTGHESVYEGVRGAEIQYPFILIHMGDTTVGLATDEISSFTSTEITVH
jgi:phosphotransferase system IIA component